MAAIVESDYLNIGFNDPIKPEPYPAMKYFRHPVIVAVCLLMPLWHCFSQDSTSLYHKVLHFPDKLFKKIDDKAASIDERLTRQTEKYLQRMAKEEQKLRRKLMLKDTAAAKRLFGNSDKAYASWQQQLEDTAGRTGQLPGHYSPRLDTLRTALSFIGVSPELSSASAKNLLQQASASVNVLEGRLNKADAIKKYIQERRRLLQQELERYGMVKQLKAFKKEVYYYQAQVETYRNMLNDPSALETRALQLLYKVPAFADFFRKNSQLANLFRMPGSAGPDNTTAASLSGLQTRGALQEQMGQRFGTGPSMVQTMQQGVQSAQSQLNELKDKISQAGGGGSDADMPDFKPNNQKTKSFLQRLELGSNLQTVKNSRYFPTTTDIGLSVGYKLNDKSILGIGSSYKMGWGKDIQHIDITHQGVGLRSFLEYKLKGSFWMSGGMEWNYRNSFNKVEELKNYTGWQRSALLGVSKKYKISQKFKGNVQLLYDFLWKKQVPVTEAIKFRMGYNFR